jgi:hypothetical protein
MLSQIRQSYSKERFQAPRQAFPRDTFAAGNLASAVGTILGTWTPPLFYGQCVIYSLGFAYAAAGGAQTVNGTLGGYVNGVALADLSAVQFVVPGLPAHAVWGEAEVNLNGNDLINGTLLQPPSFPVINPGDVFTWRVVTQGTGAGDQTVWPYLMYAINPTTV